MRSSNPAVGEGGAGASATSQRSAKSAFLVGIWVLQLGLVAGAAFQPGTVLGQGPRSLAVAGPVAASPSAALPVPQAVPLLGAEGGIAGQSSPDETTGACVNVLYDNTNVEQSWFGAGSYAELIDFGTTGGGRICRFSFAYVTELTDPGTVSIAFYRNTTSTTCPGVFLTGWNFSGLAGSTDGTPQAFSYYYDIPEAQRFNLPAGAFGYSYTFDNADTGVFLASGGAGQQNEFWVDCGLTWFGGDPWAGAYLKLTAESVGTEHCYSPPDFDLELVPDSVWQTTDVTSFSAGECRLYRIYMEAAKSYDFSLCGNDGVGSSFVGDGDLALLNSSGTQLWYIDGAYDCGFDASTLGTTYQEYSPPTDGFYYLKVDDYYDDPGSYVLAYKMLSPVPEIRVEPASLEFDCTVPSGPSDAPVLAAGDPLAIASVPADKLVDEPEIMQSFAAGKDRVDVIVLLQPPARPGPTNFNDAKSLKSLQDAVAQRIQAVKARVPAAEIKERHTFGNIPGFSASLTQAGLNKLLQDPDVISIEPVRTLTPHLQQGLALMNALTHRSAYNGQNMSVAICDTGIDYNHPKLGGGGFPNSKILGGYDFGDNDGDPMDCQGHGTACAGIAAGDLGSNGDYVGGVAYSAKLYALKIAGQCGGSAGSDAMIAAWDWCVTHKNDNPAHPIMVISTSFGGGRYYNSCDSSSPGMTAAAAAAVAAGITLTCSSGNDGYCDSTGWPACISHVIAVGAVFDASFGEYGTCVSANSCAPKEPHGGCSTGYAAFQMSAPDLVTSYSNTAHFLGVFAPSTKAYTTDISGAGGYTSGDYTTTFGGTSAACPYAAGAIASLQQAAKALTGSYLTPAEVRTVLASTGDPLTDPKVAITKSRVNLGNAINSLDTGECQGPTLTIHNDGAGVLEISAVDRPSWVTLEIEPPYAIAPGSSLEICVEMDCGACAGTLLNDNLVIHSNDPVTPSLSVPVTATCGPCYHPADMDGDCDVDLSDLQLFIPCAAGPGMPYAPVLPAGCLLTPDESDWLKADLDGDGDIDVVDFAILQRCWSGSGNYPDAGCED